MRIFRQVTITFCILIGMLACSSKTSLDNSFSVYSSSIDVAKISAPEKEVTLVFFRSFQDRQNNPNIPANVFVNDRYLSTLLTEGYAETSVCPGANTLFITTHEGGELAHNYAPKSVSLDAGKTYFVSLNQGLGEQYEWQLLNAEDAAVSINGLKRQVHTISRYAEDCSVKLAREEARARERQDKIEADKLVAEQQATTLAASTPIPVVPVPELVSSPQASEMPAKKTSLDVVSVRILFPFAQFEWGSVNSEGHSALQSFANNYKQLKFAKKIRLSGHADPIGDEDANILLSQKRVKSVRAALIAQGVHASFEENAIGSRKVLVDCVNDKPNDDLGDIVSRDQKVAGIYWLQVYAGTIGSEQKKLIEGLKKPFVLKKFSDGLVRVWIGPFNDFSSANGVLKTSKFEGSFVRFVPADKDFSAQSCNQPNRRVDVEIVE